MKPYYEHAGITIFHGDCREILPSLILFDLLLTDPPYEISASRGGIGGRREYLSKIRGKLDVGFDHSVLSFCPNWMCFCSKQQLLSILSLAEAQEGRWMLVTWNKPDPTPLVNGNYLPDTEYIVHHFQDSSRLHGTFRQRSRFIVHPCGGDSDHPAAKPIPVIKRLMLNGSAQGQLVVDPYMGIGSTLVAAKHLDRRAIGIEIEERYCEIAAKRLSQEVLQFHENEPLGKSASAKSS